MKRLALFLFLVLTTSSMFAQTPTNRSTDAGWLDGQEVTLVQYDKNQLTLSSLAKQAAEVGCANKVYTDDGKSQGRLPGGTLEGYRPASDSDQNKQISRLTALHSVPGLNESVT